MEEDRKEGRSQDGTCEKHEAGSPRSPARPTQAPDDRYPSTHASQWHKKAVPGPPPVGYRAGISEWRVAGVCSFWSLPHYSHPSHAVSTYSGHAKLKQCSSSRTILRLTSHAGRPATNRVQCSHTCYTRPYHMWTVTSQLIVQTGNLWARPGLHNKSHSS